MQCLTDIVLDKVRVELSSLPSIIQRLDAYKPTEDEEMQGRMVKDKADELKAMHKESKTKI